MKLLITGALGHIGSKLIHSFATSEMDEVIMLDNLATQRFASLFNLPSGVKFRFIEDDIVTADLDKYFKGVDAVVHLAAMTEAAASFEQKDEVEEVNFFGTKRVAEACRRNGCRLFFPSTPSVYWPKGEKIDENCSADEIKPQSPYAESKLRSEKLLAELGKEGLKYFVGRLGTIFGVSIGMRFHTAVNRFCWQAVMGRPITVWQTALRQKRPYLDLTDAVRAIKYVLKRDLFDNSVNNLLTVNLTVDEIIKAIVRQVPETKIELVASKIMNELSYEVGTDRIRGKGFNFEGDLEKRVRETIQLLGGANTR